MKQKRYCRWCHHEMVANRFFCDLKHMVKYVEKNKELQKNGVDTASMIYNNPDFPGLKFI